MDNIIKKLICTYENVLSDRMCDNIINKFNNYNNINNIVNNDSNFSVYRIDSNSHDFDLWKDIESIPDEVKDFFKEQLGITAGGKKKKAKTQKNKKTKKAKTIRKYKKKKNKSQKGRR